MNSACPSRAKWLWYLGVFFFLAFLSWIEGHVPSQAHRDLPKYLMPFILLSKPNCYPGWPKVPFSVGVPPPTTLNVIALFPQLYFTTKTEVVCIGTPEQPLNARTSHRHSSCSPFLREGPRIVTDRTDWPPFRPLTLLQVADCTRGEVGGGRVGSSRSVHWLKGCAKGLVQGSSKGEKGHQVELARGSSLRQVGTTIVMLPKNFWKEGSGNDENNQDDVLQNTAWLHNGYLRDFQLDSSDHATEKPVALSTSQWEKHFWWPSLTKDMVFP